MEDLATAVSLRAAIVSAKYDAAVPYRGGIRRAHVAAKVVPFADFSGEIKPHLAQRHSGTAEDAAE
jgi:hypothetical protein